MALGIPERGQVEHAERVRQTDEREERIDGKRTRATDLNQNRRAHQQGHEHDPRGDERRKAGAEVHVSIPNPQCPTPTRSSRLRARWKLGVGSWELSSITRSTC